VIVVSDTSATTSLIQIKREQLLADLFARVIIPPSVRDELLQFHKQIPTLLEIGSLKHTERTSLLLGEIDLGEAEAIVLAEETKPDYLLIDDLAARQLAIAKGLPVIGLLGVLIKAKNAGLVNSLKSIICELETVAGFRISSELKLQLFQAAGE
jgi:predicted nucleic acid-binding protein